MIVVIYEEEVANAAGVASHAQLGFESHQHIEEVLLPGHPRPDNPVFFTKKFVGHAEYRWQVLKVCLKTGVAPLTYIVTLRRRPQIRKDFYLKNILSTRKEKVRRVIHPWTLVEVEFGHSLSVGKASGSIKGNKRYADTVQLFSMPKRRLAIVMQVIERDQEDLLQVVPISSRHPGVTERASVEVTSALTTLTHYRKRSWAVCRMIQPVTASRIIAPMVQIGPRHQTRDKGFRLKVRGAVREAIKDALMFGVAANSRVTELAAEKKRADELCEQVMDLQDKLEFYEKLMAQSGLTLEGEQVDETAAAS
nr:hypothetical protein HUO10_004746 [Paraburkholderia busanensis]